MTSPQPHSGNLEWVVFRNYDIGHPRKFCLFSTFWTKTFLLESKWRRQDLQGFLRQPSTLTKGSATTLPFSEENQSFSLFDKAVFASVHLEGFCFFLWSALKIIRGYLNIWCSCDRGPQSSFSLLPLGHSSILVCLCTLIMLLLNWFSQRGLKYYLGTACEAPISARVSIAI